MFVALCLSIVALWRIALLADWQTDTWRLLSIATIYMVVNFQARLNPNFDHKKTPHINRVLWQTWQTFGRFWCSNTPFLTFSSVPIYLKLLLFQCFSLYLLSNYIYGQITKIAILPVIRSRNLRANHKNRHFVRNREPEFSQVLICV